MMTVKELKKELDKLPDDQEVYVAKEGDIETQNIVSVLAEDDGQIVLEYRDE